MRCPSDRGDPHLGGGGAGRGLRHRSLVLPRTDGALTLAGLAGEVRVERDTDGIRASVPAACATPPSRSASLHAQDRLWQLETHRRIGSGRLAEAFGEPALEADRFLRALGVKRAAAQWARLEPRTRELLEAYAEGINSFVRDGYAARRSFCCSACSPSPGRLGQPSPG